MSFLLLVTHHRFSFFFFFNDTATTEIYTLSLHDALPIYIEDRLGAGDRRHSRVRNEWAQQLREGLMLGLVKMRSEEHTSELQSHSDLVCRLLLEKKKKNISVVELANRYTSVANRYTDTQV